MEEIALKPLTDENTSTYPEYIQPIKYYSSKSEYAADNLQIRQIAPAGGYTVPAGYKFYLTAAMISFNAADNVAGNYILIQLNTGEHILRASCGSGNAGGVNHGDNSISFPTPIKINAGSSILVTFGAAVLGTYSAYVYGYLEKFS